MPPIMFTCHQLGLCQSRSEPCPGCPGLDHPAHHATRHSAAAVAAPQTPPDAAVTQAEYDDLRIAHLGEAVRSIARRLARAVALIVGIAMALGYLSGSVA